MRSSSHCQYVLPRCGEHRRASCRVALCAPGVRSHRWCHRAQAPARPVRRVVPAAGRRHERRDRTHDRAKAHRSLGPAGLRRQCPRRRRDRRHRPGREGPRERLHRPVRHRRAFTSNPEPAQASSPTTWLHDFAPVTWWLRPARAHGASFGPGQGCAGACRAGAGEPRPVQLRVVGREHAAAPGGRTVQTEVRARSGACPVQRRRARHDIDHRRAHTHRSRPRRTPRPRLKDGSPCPRPHQRPAPSGIPDADHGGSRRVRAGVRFHAGNSGSGKHAKGNHRPLAPRGRRHRRAAGRAKPLDWVCLNRSPTPPRSSPPGSRWRSPNGARSSRTPTSTV